MRPRILKDKMIKADFIIFVTPMYAISVSGDMKCFIDRITSYLELETFKDLLNKKKKIKSV